MAVGAACALVLWGCQSQGPSETGSPLNGSARAGGDAWVGVWSAAPYGPFPAGPLAGTAPPPASSLTSPGAFPDNQANDQSFRMIVRPTLGGDTARVRLSNLLGDRNLVISEVRLALRLGGAALVPGTDTPVLLDGQSRWVIPPGVERFSDPVDFSLGASEDVAISFHVEGQSGPMTWHAVSFDVQHLAPQGSGNVAGDVSGAAYSEATVGWFFVTGLDVLRPEALGSIVALGDSITDGAYIFPTTDTRWPDLLARRLQSAGIPMGVLNQGINSNRVVGKPSANGGDPAVLRFDRDVLARPGVRSVILFEGTNDLGGSTSVDDVIAGLDELIDRAHAAGLCVVLGTITPRDDAVLGYDRAGKEPKRVAVNDWIRMQAAAKRVEGLADFDAVLGAPADPTYPNPALYFPDLLHPNSLGFALMADAVPIEALVPAPLGTCRRSPR